MSRVSLGASLLVAIGCLSLPICVIAQSEEGEPEASAPGGGDGAEYGGQGGYGSEMAGEYGGRGTYVPVAAQADDLFGAPGAKADQENPATTTMNKPAAENRQNASPVDHISAALNESLKAPLQYEDQPLNEIIDTLQEEYDIPILFDSAALEEVAISPDTEVSINLRNITLRSALNLILRQPGLEDLTFVIDEEVLLITTEEKANEKLTVEVYRVDDLIRSYQPPFEGNSNPYTSLTEVITRCVAYDTWMINESGEGEVRLMQPGMLVVTNTRRVHEQVEELLEKLRKVHAQIEQSGGYGMEGMGGGYGGEGGRGGF